MPAKPSLRTVCSICGVEVRAGREFERHQLSHLGLKNAEIHANGVMFQVILTEKWCIKIPWKPDQQKIMLEMVEIQNFLHGKVSSVLPATFHDDFVIMPRAPGKRIDSFTNRRHIKELIEQDKKVIMKYGVKVQDAGSKNVFYEAEKNQIYFVDYHLWKRPSNFKN